MKSVKKAKLFREDVKDRHTNHWDLDMVSKAELERLLASPEQQTDIESVKDPKKSKGSE